MAFGRELIVKGLIECLGAYILVHSYVGGINSGNPAGSFGLSVIVGLTYMLLIGGLKVYANPAVQFGKAFGGTVEWVDAFWFFLMQVLGSFFGAVMCNIMFNQTANLFGASSNATMGPILYFEGLYSTIVVLITLRADDAATKEDEATEASSSIAAAYAVGMFLFGAKTGGLYNPAIALGDVVAEWTRGKAPTLYSYIWIHVLAPYVGAFFSALILWFSGMGGIFFAKKEQNDA